MRLRLQISLLVFNDFLEQTFLTRFLFIYLTHFLSGGGNVPHNFLILAQNIPLFENLVTFHGAKDIFP